LTDTLKTFGFKDDEIKTCAGTGITVDIRGTGPEEDKDGKVSSVAIRADMDGLPMPELNHDLEYKTTTDHAHMCGHDGHMVTILGTAQVLNNNRDKIPSNKFVRLLF
jgi:metal-dependent amidase/aminoacylase/carboxypeptidase family protein